MNDEKKNRNNATHELECRHAIGWNRRIYYMRCHVLKTMPDGRLKLRVYGERYWKHKQDVVKIRYVFAWRVRENINIETNNE